jgi:hypothetical protein
MITEEEVRQQYYKGDPFLKFDGPVCDKTPREFISFIDTIRKESEWSQTPFVVKKDKNGNYKPIVKKGLYFGFSRVLSADSNELLSIESGKKCTKYPWNVYPLIKQGCRYEDFVLLTQDVISYCESLILLEVGKKEEALMQIRKAFQLQPEEYRYASLCFEIRLQLNDESAIDEELKYYENDIDSLVHTERVFKLIYYLTRRKKNVRALQIIKLVNQLLDELIDGRRQNKIFGGQKADWYTYKKEQFNKKIEKTRTKLENNN